MDSAPSSSWNSSSHLESTTLSVERAELRTRSRMLIEHQGRFVLIVETTAGIVALDPTCPHQHVRSLDRGTICDDSITCPNHGWRFSLVTGAALCGSGRIRLYPVEVTDQLVTVTLPNDPPRWMQT